MRVFSSEEEEEGDERIIQGGGGGGGGYAGLESRKGRMLGIEEGKQGNVLEEAE